MNIKVLKHVIGGAPAGGGELVERRNPSDLDEVVSLAPDGGKIEVGAAVAAADVAFPAWRDASPEFRADVLGRIGDLVLERRDALGELLSLEEGKTRAEGIAEVVRAGRIFRFFAGEALRLHGVTVASTRRGVDAATYREPLGVIGLITPWNFPIAIPAWKAAPALALGNTVVLKPSELTPAIASALADIVQEAGAPPGVFNVVFGGRAAGSALVEAPQVKALSFTGSQATGARIALVAARRRLRLQMEMGGKNPLVVLDDADLPTAVSCALDGAFFASGQRCTASSRLIVTEAVHDAFVEALSRSVRELVVGPALAPNTRIGPLVSEGQLSKVQQGLSAALTEGAQMAAQSSEPASSARGHYFLPVLLTGTSPEMSVNQTELFGPIAAVIQVKDFDEALAVANAGEFGLSAGVVTRGLVPAQRFRRGVRAGMVMVNLPTAGVDYHVPFGGVGASSYGPREQGFAAIEFYSQVKTAYTSV